MSWSLYQAVQRLRKLFGLSHDYADRQSHGSGSVQTIPAPPNESERTPSLVDINKYDRFKPYDPVRYYGSDVPYGGIGVTRTLNEICRRTGLQMTVCKDPNDWKQVYHLTNVTQGDSGKLVRVRWFSGKQRHEVLLEPGESTTIKVDQSLDERSGYPEIKAFQYGAE